MDREGPNAAYLAAIVESSDDAILSKDLNGIIQSCNASAERLFGYTAAELVGHNIRILMPPDRQNEEDAILVRIRRGERVSHFETVRLTKSGRPVDVSVTVSPVRDEAGIIVGASKIIRDITDQKRARAAQSYLAALVDSSEDAILSKNLDGIIQSCNPTAERLFGYSAPELVGKSVRVLIPPDRQSEEDDILRRIRRGERVAHFETVRVARDGRRMDISLSISPIRDRSGTIIGASKIARDITEQKRIAAELAAQQEWFRVTLESIGDAVVACDPDSRVTYMNMPAQTLTGWSAGEASGHPLAEIFQIVNEKTRRPVENPAELVIRTGHIIGLANHSVLIDRNGTEHPIADSAAPIRDPHGQIIGVVLVFHDVTDERAAEIAIAEQREWLQTTLASIGDAMIATDPDGRVSYMNHVAESLTGWKTEEALGRNLQDIFTIVNEQTREPVENPALRAIREGRIVGLANHTVLIAKTGLEIPIDDSGSPIKRPDGTISGAVLIFRDITQRRLLERERESAVRASRRLAAIVESSNDSIIGTDSEFRITSWNKAAERMFGYTVDEAVGRSIRLIVPENRWDEEESVMHRVHRGTEITHFETERQRKDGAIIPVSVSVSPIYDSAGAVVGASKIARDITQQKRAAEVEAQARRTAEEANRAKDDFLAMVSHELRTPLTAVAGWVRILKAGKIPPDRADHALEVIERNTNVEVRFVDSLLDLSCITAGKLQLDSERVALPDILEAVLDSVRPAADSKNISLEMTVTARPLAIVGDSGRIQQIFWNLLTNAIKFTPSGGRISVRITHRGSQAQIQVIDDGEGIDAEFLPHVFERFRQADTGKSRSQKGLGLGLAIVRELVQAHGGAVFAESAGRGKGSTFTVMFPISAVIPPRVEVANPSLFNREKHSIAGLRILVVDDDADARELVGLTLQSSGALVQSASSSTEALKLISRDKPDVMIADIEMPGEDGYVLIRALRAIERGHSHKRLPAIALTADVTPADRDQALAAGYDIHLAKPVGLDDLTQALASLRK